MNYQVMNFITTTENMRIAKKIKGIKRYSSIPESFYSSEFLFIFIFIIY